MNSDRSPNVSRLTSAYSSSKGPWHAGAGFKSRDSCRKYVQAVCLRFLSSRNSSMSSCGRVVVLGSRQTVDAVLQTCLTHALVQKDYIGNAADIR